MLITYDPLANVAYISIVEGAQPGGEAGNQEIVGEDIVLDYDDDGKLLGIEILNARNLLRSEVLLEAKRMVADMEEQLS